MCVRERERDRQTDRQTDRQREGGKERKRQREGNRHVGKKRMRKKNLRWDRQIEIESRHKLNKNLRHRSLILFTLVAFTTLRLYSPYSAMIPRLLDGVVNKLHKSNMDEGDADTWNSNWSAGNRPGHKGVQTNCTIKNVIAQFRKNLLLLYVWFRSVVFLTGLTETKSKD